MMNDQTYNYSLIWGDATMFNPRHLVRSYEDQGVFLQGPLPCVTFRSVPANYQK